jgi:hypothetical protein
MSENTLSEDTDVGCGDRCFRNPSSPLRITEQKIYAAIRQKGTLATASTI